MLFGEDSFDPQSIQCRSFFYDNNPREPAVTPTVRKNINSKIGRYPAFFNKN